MIKWRVEPARHLWLRLCRHDWKDPFDPSWAGERGGRWNPPRSWPTLYLNRDLLTARRQIERLLEGTAVEPDDLTDDAYELAAGRVPAGQIALDVVTVAGVADVQLPSTYPADLSGARVRHEDCWPIASAAHAEGLDGVECRSAATLDGTGRELAWWPRGRTIAAMHTRLPYGVWRSESVTDSAALFPN